MALLFPALSRARKQARAVACQANLRQWGIRASTYQAEHEGQFMVNPLWSWILLHPDAYRSMEKLCLCPAATRCEMTGYLEGHWLQGRGGTFTAWWINHGNIDTRPPTFRLLRGSYGSNALLEDPNDLPSQKPRELPDYWTPATIKRPSTIPFLADCSSHVLHCRQTDVPPAFAGEIDSIFAPLKNACLDRHSGGINVLFMDGSTRNVGLKELWTLRWSPVFDTTGPWTQAGGGRPEDWPQWMRKFKDH
jgi:prepilin-type processing-associated H-X9-DG protein